MFEYSSGVNVGINAGWPPREFIEQTRQIMAQIFLNKSSVFGVALPLSGKVIGSVGLIVDPKRENERARILGTPCVSLIGVMVI
ncbi:MAG: hypothetical protein RR931_01865 [Mucinivorans sp.]